MLNVTLWDREIPYRKEYADTPNAMTFYPTEATGPQPCVLVMPGGGYNGRAEHEGEPIACFFNSVGMHAAVLHYRVNPNRFPAALSDAQRAIRIIRANARKWNVDPDKIVTCGFSAGGHLCASSILYEDVYKGAVEADEIDVLPHLPNGAILCYPVISFSKEHGHVKSGYRLLGEENYEAEHHKFDLTQYVTEKTPPVFLWHTSEDAGVSVKNSLHFAEKLRDCHIPFELHVFPKGPHGIGLAEAYPDACKWPSLAADWIRRTI